VLAPPVPQRAKYRAQFLALLGQQVFGARRVIGVEPALDDAVVR
jgi:hypothetical protein